MSHQLAVLDALPCAADFYGQYWNRRPFAVRGAIPEAAMQGLIAADELAGLAMEEAPQSRMVKSARDRRQWSCRFGPFGEQDFSGAGDRDWSLLVRHVDQFHPGTAGLLGFFNFAPRWLMDDIMVSFSATGGTVGPHMDSYHVFLVQGQGRRRWTVGRQAIADEVTIDGIDLKLLDGGLEGDEIEVSCGDVLYLPPKFGHEGTTLADALTYSVGFLGPKLSELFGGYGQYLSECEDRDHRYAGDGLAGDSAGFAISAAAAGGLGDSLVQHLKSPDFSRWLVAFFSESSHEDFGNFIARDGVLGGDAFAAKLRGGARLVKPHYVKFAVTPSPSGGFWLGFEGHGFILKEGLLALIQKFMEGQAVSPAGDPALMGDGASLELLRDLYNHQALEFLAA